MTENSDVELITEYLKGDEKSLEILFAEYLKPVYRFVFAFVFNKSEAEDITQETFVKAWKNLKKFDRSKNFKTWLFSIARNTAIDFLRKKKNIPFSAFENSEGENLLEENLSDPSPLPPEIFEKKEIAKEVEAILEKIPPNYREVLMLHYKEDLPLKEIAEISGESPNTVKSRHRRALIILKEILRKNN